MYIANRESIRWPSTTASSSCTGSHTMPVSSPTSLTATSAGEYPTSAQPVGYSQNPESALHEEDLTAIVAHDRADRHLRCHIAGDVDADRLHPLLDEVFVLVALLGGDQHLVGSHLDVGGHPQDLLEAFRS